MKREMIEKWRDALRSGEFKQGYGKCYNKADDTFCVLGVANRVVGEESLNDISKRYSLSLECKLKMETNGHPRFVDTSLIGLNDNGYLNFDEFADLLDIALIQDLNYLK